MPAAAAAATPAMAAVVDLRLASSYIPAIVCMLKSQAVAALATLLVRVGGAPALTLALVLDRMHWNSCAVFDVNAVVACVLGLCVATEERHHRGAPTPIAAPVLLAWGLVSLTQILRPWLKARHELLLLCALGTLVSFTHQAIEPLPAVLGRVLVYVASTVCAVYAALACGAHPSPHLFLFTLRAGPVLLAPLAAAIGYGLVLLVIAAVQARRGAAPAAHEAERGAEGAPPITMMMDASPHIMMGGGGGGTPPPAPATSEELLEQQQLRQALAQLKGSRAQ